MSKTRFDKQTRWLREQAEELGFRAEHTNGGHIRLIHPEIPIAVFASSSPICQFGHKKAVAMMQRLIRRQHDSATA